MAKRGHTKGTHLPAAQHRSRQQKEAMLAALKRTLGIVTSACEIAQIPRATHYKWMAEDPEYAKRTLEVSDMQLDFAESQLMKKIKMDDTASIIFYLKCRGKKRGYIERTETDVHVKGELDVGIKIKSVKLEP